MACMSNIASTGQHYECLLELSTASTAFVSMTLSPDGVGDKEEFLIEFLRPPFPQPSLPPSSGSPKSIQCQKFYPVLYGYNM